MNTVAFVIAVVLGLLIAETRLSWANERTLRTRGAFAPPGDVYAALAVLYPGAFLSMGAEGLWRGGQSAAVLASGPSWLASGILMFCASKALKYWAIRSLGARWTFRVLVAPGLPLVTGGPYRYLAHPNYVAVMGELVGTAMMCGARVTGIVSLVAFGAALWMRVRFEERVLRSVRASQPTG